MSFAMWAAIFIVVHPLSIGPLIYVESRWWDPSPLQPVLDVFYAPEIYLLTSDAPWLPGAALAIRSYANWWDDLGEAHAAAP